MALKGYIAVEALDGGYVVEVSDEATQTSDRQVVSSKAKAIKIIRDAFAGFEGEVADSAAE